MDRQDTNYSAVEQKLRQSKLIGDLGKDSLFALERLAKRVSAPSGTVLFLQNDPGDALFMVEQGSVEICMYSEAGKKLSLNVMRPPDVFGEIAALDGGKRTASATVLEASTLLRFDRSRVLEAIHEHPEIAADLIRILCQRLRWVSQQVEDLAMLDIEGRLANRLLILHRKFADDDGYLRLSQSELADFLGVTRESINKTLQRWKLEGLIELSRGAVLIRNERGLEMVSGLI